MSNGEDKTKKALQNVLFALEKSKYELAQYKKYFTESIAIIGLSCRFPGGANTADDYWKLLVESKESNRLIPESRWDAEAYYDSDPDVPGKMFVNKAHFLDIPIDQFDASFYRMSPREAELLDPQQRILLELSWETFENAGIKPSDLVGSKTGVFIGMMLQDYGTLFIRHGGVDGINAFSGVGSDYTAAAGRLSFFYGFRGPSVPVLTACSSSLVATHLAVKSLLRKESDLALAGGVNLMMDPAGMLSLSKMGLLSPDGLCKTFDASANGYGRGEGCGFVLLKRLSDAKKDNDNILAVIRGSSTNHNGASSGLTVPSSQAQQELYVSALSTAGLKPEDISYIETHGTGTSLGDPIETGSIAAIYGDVHREQPLWLGAVKSNIGHLEGAAGIAGLIKTILCLQHGKIPPQMHLSEVNPAIVLGAIPAKIPIKTEDWKVSGKRIAAVSSFGATGINGHMILEEAPEVEEKESQREERPLQLLTISAKSKDALKELIEKYKEYVATTNENLQDITYTANIGRNHERFRAVIIAKDLDELKTKLEAKELTQSEVQEDKKNRIEFNYPDAGTHTIHGEKNNVISIDIGPETNWSELLSELANYYVNGADINWNEFDSLYDRHKVILPTYPFQRKHYWADAAKPSVGRKLSTIHPLLGEKRSKPNGEVHFINELHLSELAYLRGHQVYQHVIYPGAGFIEMLLASGLHGLGEGFIHLENVSIEAALGFEEGKAKETQVIFNPETSTAEVYSATPAGWQRHATGMVSLVDELGIATIDLEAIKDRCDKTISQEAFYNKVNSTSIHYTGLFQAIKQLHFNEKEAFAELLLADSAKEYLAHPALLDGSLQLLITSFLNDKATEASNIYLPVGLDSMMLWAPLDKTLFGYWHEISFSEEVITGDITLCDKTGKILAQIEGMQYRRTTEQALKKMLAHEMQVDQWLYEWAWEKLPLTEVSEATENGHWLILSDGVTQHEQLTKVLDEKSQSYQIIKLEEHPKNKEEFVELIKQVNDEKSLSGILHLSSLNGTSELSAETILEAQRIGSQSVLHLSQALVELQEHIKVPLFIFTENIYAKDNQINLNQSPITGLHKSIVAEHPELRIKHVDLDSASTLNAVIDELFSEDEEEHVLYRNKERRVGRLQYAKIASEVMESPSIKFSKHHSYLITGGLGGLGLTLAHWLAEKGAGEIILTGRRELNDEAKEAIKNIEILGAPVRYQAVNISDGQAVKTLLTQIKTNDKSLKGIFHLAGVLDDATLLEQAWPRFEKVFAAKVYGSWNLHDYAEKLQIELDYFVLFSSVASTFGGPGQSNYAAANSFMDTLAYYRREKGLVGQSFSWGPWRDVGMPKELVSGHAKLGLKVMTPKQGMQALETALMSNCAHLSLMNINWPHYLKQLIVPPTWLQAFVEKSTTSGLLMEQLKQIDSSARQAVVEDFVENTLRQVLGLGVSQSMDVKTSFLDLGMDSLMVVELKNRLQAALGKLVILSSADIFNYNTSEKLSERINGLVKVGGKILKKKIELKDILQSDKWIIEKTGSKPTKLRVFCFHHLGGGPSAFLSWREKLPDDVSLCCIQLPGREWRSDEPLLDDVSLVVQGLLAAILPYVNSPYLFFGHSQGAMLSSEVARQLQIMGQPAPKHLILSCCSPIYNDDTLINDLTIYYDSLKDDAAFVQFLDNSFGGIPEALLTDETLLKSYLPVLRSDASHFKHSILLDKLFDMPITTIYCEQDKAFKKELVHKWSKLTTAGYEEFKLPGGHFEILDNPNPFIEILLKVIAK